MKKLRCADLLPLALLFFISVMALRSASVSGDGYEYLLTAHALFRHFTLVITPADIDSLSNTAGTIVWFPGATLADLLGLLRQHIMPRQTTAGLTYTLFADAHGQFRGIHFWMYSILSLPFHALLHALRLNPHYAFTLINLSFATAVLPILRKALPQRPALPFILFLLAGTSFYMNWSGPEVMTASCVLTAFVLIASGKASWAIFLIGLAASQNPSLIFSMPFALGYHALLLRNPALAWPGRTVSRLTSRDILLILCGGLMAVAPYLYSQLVFGTPSIIARYYNDQHLISFGRLHSLFFDLNQGMLIGSPGVLAMLAMALLFLPKSQRWPWLCNFLLTLAVVMAMAIPVLSAINWNSGAVGMSRYSYWLSMPLLASALQAVQRCNPQYGRNLLLLGISMQLLTIANAGLLGGNLSYVTHAPQAKWVLDHFPAFYNPEPEIFQARTSPQFQMPMPNDLIITYPTDGVPSKLMRHESNLQATSTLCPPGQIITSQNRVAAGRGWQYLHAPFSCKPAPSQTINSTPTS